jgi:predicted lipoprotein with Yx(FWY)xxD motif
MKKINIWIAIAVVVVIVALGGYAIFHKTPAKTVSTTTTTSSNPNIATSNSVNNSVVITKTNSNVGNYLADPNGNTLYTIGSGAAGVSSCTGSCLSAWPPYIDKGTTAGLPANISSITRSDNGDIQYTYKGMPLYYFASDTSGQVTGNGVSGFSVAKP